MAFDQGSDRLASASCMRHFSINAAFVADCAHGAQNDLHETLRECAFWAYWLLLLTAMNVEHGPFNDDLRWNQSSDCRRGAVEHHEPNSFP